MRSDQRRADRSVLIIFAAALLVLAACDGGGEAPATDQPQAVVPDGAYAIDLNTGEMTPLPESLTGGWSYPVSPDGTMFAYTFIPPSPVTDPPYRLYFANVDGTGVHEVPTGVPEPHGPSWSPDGSMLVYQGIDPFARGGDLFVVDVTTDEVRRITDLERRTAWWWWMPSFGPDGETILFHMPRRSDAGTRWDLWSVPVAGGEPTIVRPDAAMGVYAPDGGTLAYLEAPRAEDGGAWSSSLWLADADGSDPRLLVEGDGDFLRWSPDGTRIVYAGDGEIHVVDVATGESTNVADGGTAEWFDDHTLVVSPAGVTP